MALLAIACATGLGLPAAARADQPVKVTMTAAEKEIVRGFQKILALRDQTFARVIKSGNDADAANIGMIIDKRFSKTDIKSYKKKDLKRIDPKMGTYQVAMQQGVLESRFMSMANFDALVNHCKSIAARMPLGQQTPIMDLPDELCQVLGDWYIRARAFQKAQQLGKLAF